MNTQVNDAVKGATNPELTTHVVVMTDPLRKAACKAIDATFKAYTAKNGLKDLEQKIEEATKSTASSIMELAQTSQRMGGVYPGQIRAWFSSLCSVAEQHFKDDHKVTDVASLLPCWAVYKSEILRAVKIGLRPTDYTAFNAMKTARIAKEKADKEAKAADGGTQTTDRGARPEGNAQRAAGQSNFAAAVTSKAVFTPQLVAILQIQQASMERMDSATQDLFAQKLSQLISKFNDKLQPAAEPAKDQEPEQKPEQIPAAAEQAA